MARHQQADVIHGSAVPPDETPSDDRILAPYSYYDMGRSRLVTLHKEFDPVHAVGQVSGVLRCVSDILDQLGRAIVVDLGNGIERIEVSSPVAIDDETRSGPYFDPDKVSGYVNTIAGHAIRNLFVNHARRNGYRPADALWQTTPYHVVHFEVEAPCVMEKLRGAGKERLRRGACIRAWYDEVIEGYHGREWWPRRDFILWFIAQPKP